MCDDCGSSHSTRFGLEQMNITMQSTVRQRAETPVLITPTPGPLLPDSCDIPEIVVPDDRDAFPEIPDTLEWKTILTPYYREKDQHWSLDWKFRLFANGTPDPDFRQGNMRDSIACIELVMRPVAAAILSTGFIWDIRTEQRLRRCGIGRSGHIMFENAQGPSCPHGLQAEVFYAGFRYFLIVVLAMAAPVPGTPPRKNGSTDESAIRYGLPTLGFNYAAVSLEKALSKRYDA